MPGVEVRRLRCEKQQRAREVGRLAEPAFRNAREEALAHFPRTIAILEHPMRERRTKYGRSQRVDRDTGIAPLAAQRLRSEEHTSELQSRENLVCRLLLE